MTNSDIQLNGKAIGAFLRSKRKECNLTQQQVADLCNISPDTCKKWEQGSRIPSLVDLVKLSQFYHVSIETILQLEQPSYQAQDERPVTYDLYSSSADPITQGSATDTISSEEYSDIILTDASSKQTEFGTACIDPHFTENFMDISAEHVVTEDKRKFLSLKLGFIMFAAALVIALIAWLVNLWIMRKSFQDHYPGSIARSIEDLSNPEQENTLFEEV